MNESGTPGRGSPVFPGAPSSGHGASPGGGGDTEPRLIAAAELLAAMNTDPGQPSAEAGAPVEAGDAAETGDAAEPEPDDPAGGDSAEESGLPEGVAPLGRTDPARIGAFELLGRIGAGGMGAVFLGRDDEGRLGAVKLIRPEYAADPSFLARFQDEVALADRVSPFCTAQVLDHGIAEHNRPYLVTEYVEGLSLERQVIEHGALPAANLHGVAVGVAAGLTAIHAAGLVHRDLKPANVILSWSGPRVIDFGIARAMDAPQGRTQNGIVLGSPGWMSPEQLAGAPVTPASDIFNWGCLVCFAANGRHPFGEGDPVTMAGRMMHGQPNLGDLDEPLRGLAAAAMSKIPSRRPTARYLMLGSLGRPEAKRKRPPEAAESIPDTRSAVDAVLHRWQPPAPPPYRRPPGRPVPPGPMPGRGRPMPPGAGRPPVPAPGPHVPPGVPPHQRPAQPGAGPPAPPPGRAMPGQRGAVPPPPGQAPPGTSGHGAANHPAPPAPGYPVHGQAPADPPPRPRTAAPQAGAPQAGGDVGSGLAGGVVPGEAGAPAPAGHPPAGHGAEPGATDQAGAAPPCPGQGAVPRDGDGSAPAEPGGAPGGPAASGPLPVVPAPGTGGTPGGETPGRGGRGPQSGFPWWVVLAGLLIVLVVLLVGMAAVMGDRSPGASREPSDSQGQESQPERNARSPEATMHGRTAAPDELGPGTVHVGKEGSDHDMRFVVNSVSCGRTAVGEPPGRLTAKGSFCLADTRVTNAGGAPATLDITRQRLYDTDGHAYTATAYGVDEFPDKHLFDQIRPGQTATGTIVFDIPESATAEHLVLHADPTGKGLTVQL